MTTNRCNFCTKTFPQLNYVESIYIHTLFDSTYQYSHLLACNRCEMEIVMVYENYSNLSISTDRATNKCHVCYSDTVYVFNVSAKHTHIEDSFLRKLQYCSGVKPKRNPLCVCYKCIFILDLWYKNKILYENNAKHITPTRQPKVTLLRDYGQGLPKRRSLFKSTDKSTQKLEKLQKSLLLTIKQFKNSSGFSRVEETVLKALTPARNLNVNCNSSIKRDYKMYSQVCCVNLKDSSIQDPYYLKEPRVILDPIGSTKAKKSTKAVHFVESAPKRAKIVGSRKRKSQPFKLENQAMKKQPKPRKTIAPPPKKPPAKKRARKAPPKKIPQPETIRKRTESMSSDRTEFEFDASQFVSVGLGAAVISSNSRTPSPELIQPMMLVRNLTANRIIDNDTITCDLTSSTDGRPDPNLIIPDVTREPIQLPQCIEKTKRTDDVIVVIHGMEGKEGGQPPAEPPITTSKIHDISDESSDATHVPNTEESKEKLVDQDPEVQSTVPDSPVESTQNEDYVFNIDSDPTSNGSGNASPACEVISTIQEKQQDFEKVSQQLEQLED